MDLPGVSSEQVQSILASIQNATRTAGQDFYSDVMGFVHAINWREPWLRGLGAFHLLVWVIVIATRHSHNLQMVCLLSVLGLTYASERINRLVASRWQEFAGQNYFDKRGVFTAVMLCLPLLCGARAWRSRPPRRRRRAPPPAAARRAPRPDPSPASPSQSHSSS